MSRHLTILGALSLVYMCLVPSIAGEPGVDEGAVAFGQSASLTGTNRLLGMQYRAGILAAFNEQNEHGGINGRTLQLTTLDDGYEPNNAAENADYFVATNNVLAVLGGVGTPTAARIAPILRTANIPFVGHVTGADFLHDAERFPNVVNLRASYSDEVRILVDHMANKRDRKRFGIIYQDDAFGRAVMRSYINALDELNLPLLAKTSYSRNTHAVHASIFGLMKADLDAVLLVGTYSANSEIMNLANSLGLNYVMANLSFSLSSRLKQTVIQINDRILATEVVPDPNDAVSELIKRFQRALNAAASTDEQSEAYQITEVSLEGYILGRFVIDTLKRMDDDLSRVSFLEHSKVADPVNIDEWTISFDNGSNTGSKYVRLIDFGGLNEIWIDGTRVEP